jgi:serralysin
MERNHGPRSEWWRSNFCLAASGWVSAVACVAGLMVRDVHAYSANQPWSVTASGSPTTVTWGFADEGTLIPASGSNDLISFFDGVFGVIFPSGDLTQRTWFPLFEDSFVRWSELSGVNFVYEGADDGATLQNSPGVLGVRADIRVGGKFIDGPSGALAAAWMPNTGDIVLDTGDAAYFALALTGSARPRNTLMHEIGHTLGLMHVSSSDAALLMEPQTAISFQGPQLDDIRGMQSLYGDANEKSYGGLGNGTAARATTLGTLSLGNNLSVGGNANGDQIVLSTETDFASIHSAADADYYSFTISNPGVLNVNLTPWGGTFNQMGPGGVELLIDAASASNLSLAILAPNGSSILRSTDSAGSGAGEAITGLQLAAGQYFVRILGADDAVQLYELQLSLNQTGETLPGDFDSDGFVSGSDFIFWQRSYGSTGVGLGADGNGDGRVDSTDLTVWRTYYGQSSMIAGTIGVPEPHSGWLLSLLVATATGVVRRPASI